MQLWLVSRTDDHFDLHEDRTVLVRAEGVEEALFLVCGGPDPEHPDLKVFARHPMRGFRKDRSNAEIKPCNPDGNPGVILSG